tara:strand:- start:6 stop:692 length:687 start_codon:yes stop_codon:yes gene_type:complete
MASKRQMSHKQNRKFIMTHSANNANTDTNKAVLNTPELIGADLARRYKLIKAKQTKFETGEFKEHTKADGFDTVLGHLMVLLTSETDSGRIKSERLAECSIKHIDKRRRSEAKWFVENEVEAREFIAKSKKGYTSLSALQKAIAKANKQPSSTDDTASTDKPEASSKPEVDASPKTSEAKPATKETIFKELLAICKASDVNIMDIAEMLMLEAEMPTPEELADEKKVA